MIRIASLPKSTVPAWHATFVTMLPAIARHAKIAFRHLRSPEAREEAIQEVICNACCAVARLAELGKLDLAYASVLARFGVAQTRDGRKVGCKLNIGDVMSPYCQRLKDVVVERLDRHDDEENAWAEIAVEDKTTGPADIVAFRCDFSDWLACLSRRDRRIAKSLAIGNRTSDVAKRFDVSAGRVSQLRRELAAAWREFVSDDPEATAA